MVGDSVHDMASAQRAGVPAYGVLTGAFDAVRRGGTVSVVGV